jgi:hypothetical protein
VDRSPEGLKLELRQDANHNLVIDYDHNGDAPDWWSVYGVFENGISIADYPLFEANWDVQIGGQGSTFIQFLVETEDGQRTWISSNRLIYPAKRYLLANILKNYSRIVGVMIGKEFQKDEKGIIVLSSLNFFRVPEVDVTGSQNSKWNWIDVEDGVLLINRNANFTIPFCISETVQKSKYTSLSILPSQEGKAYANIILDDGSMMVTNFSYLKSKFETNQTFLIVLKNSQKIVNITIQTTSSEVLYGLSSGT